MLKFLRKYNKILLVVAGSFLMVVFLVQGTCSQMGRDPRKMTAARIDGGRLSMADLEYAGKEVHALGAYAPPLMLSLFGLEDRDPLHWILLTREAEAAGYVGEAEDGVSWVPRLAEECAQIQVLNESPQVASYILRNREIFESNYLKPWLERLSDTSRVIQGSYLTDEQFHRALAKARGVTRMLAGYRFAARMSDRRAIDAVRAETDAAYIDYVVVPAERIAGEVPEPDEAALQAFFEKFKSTPRGGGEFGIGYLQPARVKLEWLKVDRDAIRKAIKIDPLEAYKLYKQDPSKFAGQPFEKVQSVVESQYREQVVDQVMAEVHQAVKAAVLSRTRKLDEDGPYKKIPEGWEGPKFADLAPKVVEDVKQATGHEIPLPEVFVRASTWLTAEDLDALPGIGGSNAGVVQGQRVSFSQVALTVRQIAGDNPLGIQAGIPVLDVILKDIASNRYYFTVLDALKESPPQSLDEVRARVVADFKEHAAYERAVAAAEEIRKVAVEGGVSALLPKYDPAGSADIVGPLAETPLALRQQVAVRATSIQPPEPAVDTEAVRSAVMAAARKFDPMAPVPEDRADDATIAVPVPGTLGLLVGRITALEPTTAEAIRTSAVYTSRTAPGEEFRKHAGPIADNPFSLASLKKRHGYVAKRRGDEEIEPEEPAETAPAEDTGTS